MSTEKFSGTDIIVPVLNLKEYTKLFVESVKNQTNYRLIIIDNGSSSPTKEYLKSLAAPNIILIRNEQNLGYVKAINQGLAVSNSESILLGNNDTIFSFNLLGKLRDGLKTYDIVGPLTNNVSDRPDPRLIDYKFTSTSDLEDFARLIARANLHMTEKTDYIYGHCLLMKREVFEKLGFLDERFGIGNSDDIDYCRRAIKAGFSIGIVKSAFIYHFCHTTFNNLGIDVDQLMEMNRVLLEQKWHKSS